MPVGLMRTLRARLDLDTDGDKVLFRRFGGESDLRTLGSGHTVIRGLISLPQVDGFHRPRSSADVKEWLTVTVPLKTHSIMRGG